MNRTRPNDQWTEYSPPWVEEIPGEPFRYRVESRSGREDHLVDLTERDGHGECSCEAFKFTAKPNFDRHGLYIPYAPGRHGVTECVHIRAAFDYFHTTVTQPMLASMRSGVTHPPA